MKTASHPVPENEEKRIEALREYKVLDTLPEQAYDDFNAIAAAIMNVPISLVVLVDEGRQWFKSKIGLGVDETSREYAFCAHTIMSPDVMVINDATQDERFADNPLVTEDPRIRFYAGAPLISNLGFMVGTVCTIDRVPREITDQQKGALEALARQVMARLELRRSADQLAEVLGQLKSS